MRFTFGDILRLHFDNLGVIDVVHILIFVMIVAAISQGAAHLRGARGRETSACPDLAVVHRWIRATIGLALVSATLSVVGLAYHQVGALMELARLGPNITPADLTPHHENAFLTLAVGLLIATFGLLGGWILEWFADGAEAAAKG